MGVGVCLLIVHAKMSVGENQGPSAVGEHLSSTCKSLGSIPSTAKNKTNPKRAHLKVCVTTSRRSVCMVYVFGQMHQYVCESYKTI